MDDKTGITLNKLVTSESLANGLIEKLLGALRGKQIEPAVWKKKTLVLTPQEAAQLGISSAERERTAGVVASATTVQLDINNPNSLTKSAFTSMMISLFQEHEIFKLLMLNLELQAQRKLMEFLENDGDTELDIARRRVAVAYRLNEEMLAIEKEEAALKVAPDYSSPDFAARLKKDMAEKEVWLSHCDQADDEWADRVLSPYDSDENRAFRAKFQTEIEKGKEMRREHAENLSKTRIGLQEKIKTARPEEKARLEAHLKKVQELEEEHEASSRRSTPKNLEKHAFAHLEQFKGYNKNREFHDLKEQRDAMAPSDRAEFDAKHPNFMKEYEAWFKDSKNQREVKEEILLGVKVCKINRELQIKNLEKVNHEFSTAATSKKTSSLASNVWQEQSAANPGLAEADKGKLLKRIEQTLNIAEERTRLEEKMDNPKVARYLQSIYNLANDKKSSPDEVLQQVNAKLVAMAEDTSIPFTMRNAAVRSAAEITPQTKTKLIKNIRYTMNVAEERSRNGADINTPKATEYMEAIYFLMDDSRMLSDDQILIRLQRTLNRMKSDAAVPETLRNAAEKCAASIDQSTTGPAKPKKPLQMTKESETPKTPEKTKSLFIQKAIHSLNVAVEPFRNGANIENPTVEKYWSSIFKIADNEELSNDQVLEKMQVELNNMKTDADVPEVLRNAVEKCDEDISKFTNQAPTSTQAETVADVARNGRRDQIKNMDSGPISAKSDAVKNGQAAKVEADRPFSVSPEKLADLKDASKLFNKALDSDSISSENQVNLQGLKDAITKYSDSQTSNNASSLKECYQRVNWDELDLNEDAMEIKSLIEADGFIEQIPSASIEEQDSNDIAPSKSM